MKYSLKQNCYQLWDGSLVQCKTIHAVILATLQRSLNTLQKAPASNLAFLSARHSLLCQCLMCIEVSGHMFEHLVTDGNKLQHYFRILQWFCFISNLRQTHFDDRWPCKDACLTNCCLTENLGFGPSWLLTKIGNEVLPHSAQLALVPKG